MWPTVNPTADGSSAGDFPSDTSSSDPRSQAVAQVRSGQFATSTEEEADDDSSRRQEHDRRIAWLEDKIEANIRLKTNIERTSVKRGKLSHKDEVYLIAKAHSRAMMESGELEHELNGKGPTDRAMDAGYDCEKHMGEGMYEYGLSENIAFLSGYPNVSGQEGAEMMAERFVQRWMESPTHRETLLDFDARFIGVGVVGDGNGAWYATQNFAVC